MNNDLISREETMDVIKSLQITLGGENIFRPEAKASVLECLDFVPKVDAEPVRHAAWIYNDDDVCYWWECNACGSDETMKTAYCPNCGAKMDMEEINDQK